MDESPAWLVMLSEVASQGRAVDTVQMIDAVLAGSAPGSLMDGNKVLNQIRGEYLKQAGM